LTADAGGTRFLLLRGSRRTCLCIEPPFRDDVDVGVARTALVGQRRDFLLPAGVSLQNSFPLPVPGDYAPASPALPATLPPVRRVLAMHALPVYAPNVEPAIPHLLGFSALYFVPVRTPLQTRMVRSVTTPRRRPGTLDYAGAQTGDCGRRSGSPSPSRVYAAFRTPAFHALPGLLRLRACLLPACRHACADALRRARAAGCRCAANRTLRNGGSMQSCLYIGGRDLFCTIR